MVQRKVPFTLLEGRMVLVKKDPRGQGISTGSRIGRASPGGERERGKTEETRCTKA